jgi:D-alanine-D-alanine ligase-like ATP-grasp enzyme
MQADIFEELEYPYPRARVIHHSRLAVQASEGLNFPVLVKPNVGGSGSGILKLDSLEELELAARTGALDLGIDHTALVQEHLQAKGGYIVRVEILNGEYLYALRLPVSEESFNYCPADGCNIDNPDLAVDVYTPPDEVIAEVKHILAASRADLGSVEYLIDEADDRVYYYDINPLSNFVADARQVLGFDPNVAFVDYILERAAGQE